MKTALAIVCSFLLSGAPVLLAQAPAPCAKKPQACCHCGGKMPCCQSQPVPDSQSAPAAPAPGSNQTQLLSPAPAAVAWILPAASASETSPSISPSLTAHRTPLFTRNCAFLI